MLKNNSSPIKKNLGVATIASLVSFGVSLLLAPIMTRYYDPFDYGIFAVINNMATFIATALLFALPNALPIELNQDKRFALLKVLVNLTVIGFFISLIVMLVYFVFVGLTYDINQISWIYLMLPVMVFSISLHRISQGLANAEGDFSSMAAARVSHPIVAKPLAIVASMISTSNPLYILLFEVLGYTLQSYIMLKNRVLKLKQIGGFLKNINIKETVRIIRKYRDFSLYLNLVNILTLGFIASQTVIITMNYSGAETGLFTLALSISSLPIQLVAMATASIIYHKLIDVAANRPESLFKITLTILLGYIFIGAIPYLTLFFFGDKLFGFAFGKDWETSGVIASYLALPLFTQFVLLPISSVYRVTKTIKLHFMIDVIFLLPILIMFYIASLSKPFIFVLKILALAMTFHGIAVIMFALYVTWKSSRKICGDK